MTEQRSDTVGTEGVLRYCDGIAAARTLIALEANAAALQRRLTEGWELSPRFNDRALVSGRPGVNIVLSDPMNVNGVTEIALKANGELTDVFDGNERVVGVVIQRPYMRQVYVP